MMNHYPAAHTIGIVSHNDPWWLTKPTEPPAEPEAADMKHKGVKRGAEARAAMDRAEGRRQAIELRMKGHTYRQIGDQLGVSAATALRWVRKALADVPAEEVETYRVLTLERTDAIIYANWQRARDGDYTSANLVLRAISLQCRILGLYDNPPPLPPASPEPPAMTQAEMTGRAWKVIGEAGWLDGGQHTDADHE